MNHLLKYSLINFGLTLLFAIAMTSSDGNYNYFASNFGFSCFLYAPVCILIGIVLFIIRRKHAGQGFLLSAGVLMLIGFAVCSNTSSAMH
jgi:hypothetical protein